MTHFMDSVNLTHVSITLSAASFVILLKVSYQVGIFMQEFKQLKQRVKYHDKLLGVEVPE